MNPSKRSSAKQLTNRRTLQHDTTIDPVTSLLCDAVRSGQCISLVLSQPAKSRTDLPDKWTMRPVTIKHESMFQWTAQRGGRQTHENLPLGPTIDRLEQALVGTYAHCNAFTVEADLSARVPANGRIKLRRRPPTKTMPAADHNRTKHYLIPEGVPCPFLTEIGVMTPDGKVRARHYQKFRQINRFLELVNDVLPALPTTGEIHVVDFGCGKSYLTFALHHLLTKIHSRQARITGLDLKADVIDDCRRIADKLGCEGLEFRVGDIAAHTATDPVHMAVSLHACDTATDAALARAVEWQADVILAVPCCQHELAGKLHCDALSPLLQHGILKDRFAALATDALRGKALEICGYRTQIVEFIDMEHTPKNLLIRALKQNYSADQRAGKIREYQVCKSDLGLTDLYLEEALGSTFQASIRSESADS